MAENRDKLSSMPQGVYQTQMMGLRRSCIEIAYWDVPFGFEPSRQM